MTDANYPIEQPAADSSPERHGPSTSIAGDLPHDAGLAPMTLEAYRRDWNRWRAWCKQEGVHELPAEPRDVARYIADAVDNGYLRTISPNGRHGPAVREQRWYAVSTLRQWVAAIDAMHRAACVSSPDVQPPGRSERVRAALSSAQRSDKPSAGTSAKPLLLPDLKRMVEGIDTETYPAGVAGRRDRALLLTGFAVAARPSDIAALTVADLTWGEDGSLGVFLRRRRDLTGGQGTHQRVVRGNHLATCAPCAMAWWLRLLAAANGGHDAPRVLLMRAVLTDPVRRSLHLCTGTSPIARELPPNLPVLTTIHRSGLLGGAAAPGVVREVVRRRRRRVGLDEEGYSGHSLRAGAITWAARLGVSTAQQQALSGHKSLEMLERYRRQDHPPDNTPATKLGM